MMVCVMMMRYLGCTDATACNYVGDEDVTTDTDNTLCTYVDGICDTCENGIILDNDLDDDNVCDDEVLGCTDAMHVITIQILQQILIMVHVHM